MSALTASRATISKGANKVLFDATDVQLKANVVIYNGALIVLTGGYGKPAVAGAGLLCAGWAELAPNVNSVTAGSTDGANILTLSTNLIRVRAGVGLFNNSTSTDLIAQANVGQICYLVDDNTVALTSNGSARSVAGIIMEVSSAGVFVSISMQIPVAAAASAGTAYLGAGSSDTIAAAGAISVTAENTVATVTGTTAYTLANGLFAGQKKRVIATTPGASPVGTITPATPSGFATVSAFGALGDFIEFEWTGAAWILGPSNGVTFA